LTTKHPTLQEEEKKKKKKNKEEKMRNQARKKLRAKNLKSEMKSRLWKAWDPYN